LIFIIFGTSLVFPNILAIILTLEYQSWPHAAPRVHAQEHAHGNLSLSPLQHGERVQKGIAHWDKQNHAVPAPNCILKIRGEIIKDEGL